VFALHCFISRFRLIKLNLRSNLGNNSDLAIEDGALNSNMALITL
jgi:hypothetical protein